MRVLATGFGIVSPLGLTAPATMAALERHECSVHHMDSLAAIAGLGTHVASVVSRFDARFIDRKTRRTMSKMSEMLCASALEALERAGLAIDELNRRRVALIVGSTTGSTENFDQSISTLRQTGSTAGQFSTTLFKCMSHSVALNLAAFLGFKGQVLSPSSACSTGAQAILLGKTLIDAGVCDIALCGGADEFHPGTAIAFDAAKAASRRFNDRPTEACRPFDSARDGVVVSEGASIVVLESEASARDRSARPLGLLLGGAHSCDGGNVAHSSIESMASNIGVALADAGIAASDVGYANAHATATVTGDVAEAAAIHQVFGDGLPVSSIKGNMGHSLAPCGSTEAIVTWLMLDSGVFLPTHNLEHVAPDMPPLDYVRRSTALRTSLAVTNSFAMGGFNVSLVLGPA